LDHAYPGTDVGAGIGLLGGAIGAAIEAGVLRDIRLGDLLGIQRSAGTALDVSLNVLDLLVAAVEVANGEYAIGLPELDLDINDLPGVGALVPSLSVTGNLEVSPKPRHACGPVGTAMQTSAVALEGLGVKVDVNDGLLGSIIAENHLASIKVDPV